MAEAAPDWWRSGFGPEYLALYDDFLAERTPVEVDQIERLLALRPPQRILDLPCGQGRHAIQLARRGYEVTGVDLSPYMLGVARARAGASGVRVRWLEPGGRFLLEVINGERVMGNFQEREWFTVGQLAVMERRSLNPSTGRMVVERTVQSKNGDDTSVHAVRLYRGRELEKLVRAAGFARVDLYGDWDGAELSPESLRVLVVGTMPA
jgi:hypothetical protein